MRLDRILGLTLATGLAVSVLVVLWQIFSRYVLGDPSPWTDELVRYLLIWMGLLGAAYATGQRLHLAIDLLPARLEGRARHWHGLAVQGLIIVFAIAVPVLGGFQLVRLVTQLGQRSAALGMPLGNVYLALPLAGLLITFYALTIATEHARSLLSPAVDPDDETSKRAKP